MKKEYKFRNMNKKNKIKYSLLYTYKYVTTSDGTNTQFGSILRI